MRRREFLLSVAAAAIICGCGSAPTAPAPPAANPIPVDPTPPPPPPPPSVPVLSITRILAFGDSMTEGTVSPPRTRGALTAGLPRSFPFKLQTLMSERYTSQTVVVLNAGLAGRRAAEDRERFNDALSEAKPELLLLWHGGNDLLALAGASAAQIDAGLIRAVDAVEDLVRDATGRGIHVMLATQTPVSGGLQRGGAAPYVARYNDQLKSMAAKKGAQIVDLHAQIAVTLVGQDGLHLTEAGYQQVAEVFRDAIKVRYEISPLLAVR